MQHVALLARRSAFAFQMEQYAKSGAPYGATMLGLARWLVETSARRSRKQAAASKPEGRRG